MTPPANPSPHPLRRLTASLREMREQHRERHRPSGFGFVFADRVDYLDAARWDETVAGRSFFLRRDVLRVIEEHGPDNIAPRYAMIFRGPKPVAALAAQVVTVTGDRLNRDRHAAKAAPARSLLRRALAPAAGAATARLRERLLVTSNLLSWGCPGVAFAPDEDPARLWPGVVEALYRIRRAERLTGQTNFVLIKDLPPARAGSEVLRRFSYRPLETEPNMVLALNPAWRTHADYVAALDAKYRRTVRDQVKKLTAAGCTVEPLADPAAHAARLHELYLAVHENAPVRLVTLRESFFPALARAAGGDLRCTVVRRGDELLGFITCLRDGDTAIGYYIGFDRAAAAGGLPLYLQLLHATIGDAIAWRCARLSLGRTALEPKAGLGAKPEPMNVWLRHRVRAVNWLLRGVLGAVPHAEAPERSPFRPVATEQ